MCCQGLSLLLVTAGLTVDVKLNIGYLKLCNLSTFYIGLYLALHLFKLFLFECCYGDDVIFHRYSRTVNFMSSTSCEKHHLQMVFLCINVKTNVSFFFPA